MNKETDNSERTKEVTNRMKETRQRSGGKGQVMKERERKHKGFNTPKKRMKSGQGRY